MCTLRGVEAAVVRRIFSVPGEGQVKIKRPMLWLLFSDAVSLIARSAELGSLDCIFQ